MRPEVSSIPAAREPNWLTDCSEEEADGSGTPLSDEDCMSLQEASFGTAILRRLEKIHSDIDPLQMFQTSDGPGYYANSDDDGGNNNGDNSGSGGDSSAAAACTLPMTGFGVLLWSSFTALFSLCFNSFY